jgi:hypothetical protein
MKLLFTYSDPYGDAAFDSKVWKEIRYHYYNDGSVGILPKNTLERCRMIDDLKSNHLKFFMTKEEIFKLLGVYDKYVYVRSFTGIKRCFSYKLAHCHSPTGSPEHFIFCPSGFVPDRYSHSIIRNWDIDRTIKNREPMVAIQELEELKQYE